MPIKVDLRLKPAPGAAESAVYALVPLACTGQRGWEEGPEPRGRWLIFRITGPDRMEIAERLAQSALDSALVAEAEIRTISHGSRFVITTRKVVRD